MRVLHSHASWESAFLPVGTVNYVATLKVSTGIQAVFVFFGALCASPIWGTMAQYMEGRRHTDLLFAAMNMVVIFAPSLVRSVGEAIRRMVGAVLSFHHGFCCVRDSPIGPWWVRCSVASRASNPISHGSQ
jgi:nitrate/nitrite transporter NarK